MEASACLELLALTEAEGAAEGGDCGVAEVEEPSE